MSSTSEKSGPPSSAAQTILSLVLFIHLFGVSLAMLSYTSASPIERRVLEILPYLKLLDIDPIHTYPTLARWHLTHSLPSDVDYSVEVTATLPSGSEQVTMIPPAGVWPGQRVRRYQSLANVMGNLVGNEEFEGLLPRAVAGAILRQAGSTRGKIRVTAHELPTLEDMDSQRAERRDPNSPAYRRVVYEAQVLVRGESVNLLKLSAAGEVAPVERGKPAGAGQTPRKAGARP